eukprot:3681448-Ditylum_brightwellii.AAC.1
MDEVLNSPHVDPFHLEKINWCRLYQRVLFLSYISTTYGTHLIDCFYNKTTEIKPIHNAEWQWPQQGKSDEATW